MLPSRRHFSFSMVPTGWDGIHVSGDQNARLALLRMRKACADHASIALAAGDALDRRTHDRHLPRCDIEHAIHGARVPGRAFAFHPAAQALEHRFGIKGEIGWIHLNVSQASEDGTRIASAGRDRRKVL
ncbi:hypothetical protein ACVWYI_005698 [Bradyrhizobium sp. LB13.1]